MDLAAFIRARAIAPAFVQEYQEREALVEAQLMLRDECSGIQADILSGWISTNAEWLADNKEKYERMKTIQDVEIPKELLTND